MSSPSSSPPPTSYRRRKKSCARKCERACCAIATYFPLAFVYSLTTWAVCVEAGTGLKSEGPGNIVPWLARPISLLGILLYILLNSCYTVAVFTDPGSPLKSASTKQSTKYTSLPTTEPSHDYADVQHITVSSTGSARYCKKCHTQKPDRTHHCSTCRRCVLKMDHHCPWLATCLGLHNYKAFVLFLSYTSIFCWICFLNSSRWVWTNVFEQSQYMETFAPVNIVMLAVVSGIIGIVLTGFTSWHLYLCTRGQTTIECLEKTRYLSGMRRQVERNRQDQMNGHTRMGSNTVADTLQRAGEQILEFHANAVPGASRFEEGEERTSPIPSAHEAGLHPRIASPSRSAADSPAQRALRRTYSDIEQQRERDRYEDYLDDKESEKLPNAFDLGWRRNLSHLFGPSPLLWFLPVCNTTGDGWRWEVSQKWVLANEEAARQREARLLQQQQQQQSGYAHDDGTNERDVQNGHAMSMQTLKRPGQAWAKSKQRKETDHGEDGSVDQFEVSEGEEGSTSEDDTDEPWEGRRKSRNSSHETGWRR